MYISKLRMSGFKSFYDDTTLTIASGLNGVIGPNGSGKSNIVEAIKWVMGENSSKSLRGSGMNDLIFSGSVSKASKNVALVALTIEVDEHLIEKNNKKYIKDNIIEIERQILRDSGSTYRINGKEVRAKDIQFLFADISSGSRSSNIIDQGSVGNLVLQKPIERRRILDEAAGITGISARKNETNNKLQATKKNIERLSDILNEKKSNLNELQKQAKKATLYKEIVNNIISYKEKIEVAKWKKTQLQLQNLNNQLLKDNKNLSIKKSKLKDIQEKLNIEKKLMTVALEKKKNIEEKNLLLTLDIEKINYEINSKQNDLVSLKSLKEQIIKNINFQTEILENSNNRLKELNFNDDKNNIRDNYSNICNDIKNKIEIINSKIQSKEENFNKSTILLNTEKSKVNQIRFEIPIIEKRIKDSSNQIEILKVNIKEKEDKKINNLDLKKFKKIIKENKKIIEKLQKEKQEINSKIINKKNDIKFLDDHLQNIFEKKESQKNKINELEKKLSNYLSLGYKNTKGNILKDIRINPSYRLAFCLAIGDGIEAENSSGSSVQWKELSKKKYYPLPKGLDPLSKYIKGPKKFTSFLSQVAVVRNKEEGNKYHKILRNGQIAVTKEGSLWRWDGLVIYDGKETFTHKRIESTTKILEINKTLSKENLILKSLDKEINKVLNDIKSKKKLLVKQEESFLNLANTIQHKQIELNETDKKIFIIDNQLDSLNNDLNRQKININEHQKEINKSNIELKSLDENTSKKNILIVDIEKKLSLEKKLLDNLKEELDSFQIKYALEKQKRDTLLLKEAKNHEEYKETNKKIKLTSETIDVLKNDLKEADDKITLIKLNPAHSSNKIDIIKGKISTNKNNINKLEIDLSEINEKYNKLKDEENLKINEINILKESSIRKDTQITEIKNFLKIEESNIQNELNIDLKDEKYIKDEIFEINIKDTEQKLKRLKYKSEEYSNVNLAAEKDSKELEQEVNDLTFEEKDLTKAAIKLEKAIEQLNKESRNRIINSFKEINTTFSLLFKKLFSGGKAYLELVDSADPLEAGLELMVSPPGKRLQKLSLLSGGEKALASLALIFATFINKKSPICILDEVDAPLDEGNVEKFCELLKEASVVSKKRFLVVTHNKITMGYMNKLYGITMIEPGSSKIVSVNLDEAESVYAAE